MWTLHHWVPWAATFPTRKKPTDHRDSLSSGPREEDHCTNYQCLQVDSLHAGRTLTSAIWLAGWPLIQTVSSWWGEVVWQRWAQLQTFIPSLSNTPSKLGSTSGNSVATSTLTPDKSTHTHTHTHLHKPGKKTKSVTLLRTYVLSRVIDFLLC